LTECYYIFNFKFQTSLNLHWGKVP